MIIFQFWIFFIYFKLNFWFVFIFHCARHRGFAPVAERKVCSGNACAPSLWLTKRCNVIAGGASEYHTRLRNLSCNNRWRLSIWNTSFTQSPKRLIQATLNLIDICQRLPQAVARKASLCLVALINASRPNGVLIRFELLAILILKLIKTGSLANDCLDSVRTELLPVCAFYVYYLK